MWICTLLCHSLTKAIPKMSCLSTRKTGTTGNFKMPAMNADWFLPLSRWQRQRWRAGHPAETPSERKPPSPEELARWEGQLRGIEMEGRLPGSSLTRQLVRMVVVGELHHQPWGRQAMWGPLLVGRPHARGYQPGMLALHDICWYQRSSELFICKQPFVHLVCEIAQEQGMYDLHFQVHAIQALKEATKYYIHCVPLC